MPNVYERVVEGQVVERVQPTEGDYEDTRLGVAVLEGLNGWRLAEADAPAPAPGPAPVPPAEPAGEPASTDDEHADGGTDTEE